MILSRRSLSRKKKYTLCPTLEDLSHTDGLVSARSSSKELAEDFVQHERTRNVYTRSGKWVKPVRKNDMIYYQ